MRSYLISEIKKAVQRWDKDDIYVISLYVCDDMDNPCEPTVTLGYNTEENYRASLEDASGKLEARWNYAFWLQNEEFVFGKGKTQPIVKRWIAQQGYRYYSFDEMFHGADEPDPDTFEGITHDFVNVLVEVVQHLHASGFMMQQFNRPVPIIIHELEYYEEIARQNFSANPSYIEELKDFARFCDGED